MQRQLSTPQIWGSQGRILVPALALACLAAEAWWLGQPALGTQLTVLCLGYAGTAALASGAARQAGHPPVPCPPGPGSTEPDGLESVYLEIHAHLLPIVDAVASGVPLTGEWTALAAREAARARRLLLAQDGSEPDRIAGRFETQVAGLRDTFTEAGVPLSAALRITADPPAAPGLAVAYAAREALTNVLKHAGTNCEVHLYAEATESRAEIVVTDRGPGFDPATVVPGAGLTRTYGAVRRLGGAVEITSAPGAGTRVRACWPAPPRERR